MSGNHVRRQSGFPHRVLLAAAVAGAAAAIAPAAAQRSFAEETRPSHIVTGTLAMLDLAAGKGMLKTDLGKPVFFEVTRPELFSRITVGDRLTVQLDEQGRTVKVMEAVVTELPPEPPQPSSR